jgi:hypothetical protein
MAKKTHTQAVVSEIDVADMINGSLAKKISFILAL